MAGYRRVNYYELCRLCTSSEGTKMHIFREEGRRRQLPTKIQICLPVQVCEDDSLPKIICSHCVDKLESFYDFRESCVNAEAMLESYFTSLRYSDDFTREGKVGGALIAGTDRSTHIYLGLAGQHRYTWDWQVNTDIPGTGRSTQIYLGLAGQHRYLGLTGQHIYLGLAGQHRYTWDWQVNTDIPGTDRSTHIPGTGRSTQIYLGLVTQPGQTYDAAKYNAAAALPSALVS
uniref:(California timema) hypothetical protein n=1 Tax=Timema californicum TaxID=61474 RepID=A0A7R9PAT8_TIMCA|nr:unnamed protein product [Timema californicum]